uniref:Uncharacterized protein n=1 Tax=Siphoviridae sp. cteoh1 TaxID=2826407 RepID=A0A8S5QLD0_9CAUD|nr:MAG TPA: hypothetical protein [Siphoviridae sp. cteoh1]
MHLLCNNSKVFRYTNSRPCIWTYYYRRKHLSSLSQSFRFYR